MIEVLQMIGGSLLVFGPFIYAIVILRKLDTAAKQRKSSTGETQFRLMIIDFFSLIMLIQLPLNIVTLDLDSVVTKILIVISLIATLLVWFTTIKTVSQAGIETFGWRALVSMILIPTMYIGSFYFSVGTLRLIFGNASPSSVAWLVACAIGMIASPWIVSGALTTADSASETAQLDSGASTPDPFAD